MHNEGILRRSLFRRENPFARVHIKRVRREAVHSLSRHSHHAAAAQHRRQPPQSRA